MQTLDENEVRTDNAVPHQRELTGHPPRLCGKALEVERVNAETHHMNMRHLFEVCLSPHMQASVRRVLSLTDRKGA